MSDTSFIDAVKAFETAAPAEMAALDICGIYKKVKPILKGVLPFLKLLPVYGETVVQAITALMGVLDEKCSGS